jgi:putative MFS transporter
LFAATFVDRIGRRTIMITCAGLMIVAVAVFFLGHSSVAMAISVIGAGTLTSTYMSAMAIFGVELFPPERAPTATSLAWGGNRIGAALAPIVLLPLVRQGHGSSVIVIVGTALLISVVLLAFASENFATKKISRTTRGFA